MDTIKYDEQFWIQDLLPALDGFYRKLYSTRDSVTCTFNWNAHKGFEKNVKQNLLNTIQ